MNTNNVVAGNLACTDLTVTGNINIQADVSFNSVSMNTSNIILCTNPSLATNSTSGALQVVNGGMGVVGDSYFGNLVIGNSAEIKYLSASNGTLNVLDISVNNLEVTNQFTCSNILSTSVTSTNYSNSINGTLDNNNNTWFGFHSLNYYIVNGGTNTVLNNTSFGVESLSHLQGGDSNTAFGYHSMNLLQYGDKNVSVGGETLAKITGNNPSNNNTAIGYKSLFNATRINDNTAVGYQSLLTATISSNNTCIGALSCSQYDNVNGNVNLNGMMTAIGYNSGLNDINGYKNTYIGGNTSCTSGSTFNNSTAIGFSAVITASNQVVLGTGFETVKILGNLTVGKDVTMNGNLTVTGSISVVTPSDARLKERVTSFPLVLDKVEKLNPVQFTWIDSKKRDIGFLAQEFYETMTPDVWPEDIRYTRPDGMLTLDYGKMVVVLTKAVQELKREVDILQEYLG